MTQTGPLVSVIIPAYHSSATLPACLEALRNQRYPRFETIVVNSSPEDDEFRQIRAKYPQISFIQSPVRLFPHAARNRGAAEACGELLVFTDPDCTAHADWLENLVRAYQRGCSVLVGAMALHAHTWWERGIHLTKYHWLLPGLPASHRKCAPTANTAYARSLWERIGPFDGEYFAGDGMLSWRAMQSEYMPQFVPEAIVSHYHGNALASFCQQRFWRGAEYAKVRYMKQDGVLPRLSLLFSWATLPWVLLRAGRDAWRAKWMLAFAATLPIQILGHALWACGESCWMWRALLGKRERKP